MATKVARKSRSNTVGEIIANVQKLGGETRLLCPKSTLKFHHVNGAINRTKIPEKPRMENVTGFKNPPPSILEYMAELIHYNYKDHHKIIKYTREIHWRYQNDPAIKSLFALNQLKRGDDSPFRVSFHKNNKDYTRVIANYYQMFNALATNMKNTSEMELLSLTLKLMVHNKIELDDTLTAQIHRVLPMELKKELFQKEEEITAVKTFDEINECIRLDIHENFNYDTLTTLNEAAAREERYQEYLICLSRYIWISRSEIPPGLLKHMIELVYAKKPEYVFPFQARLSLLTGTNLYPFSGVVCIDSLLEKKVKLTEGENFMLSVLPKTDSFLRKFEKSIKTKLGKYNIPTSEEKFSDVIYHYLKNSRVFLAGEDVNEILDKYNFLKREDVIVSKWDNEELTTNEMFDELVKIEDENELRANSVKFINKRLISQGYNTLAIATSEYLKRYHGIDVRFQVRYNVLLRLIGNITERNKPFIGLLYKTMALPMWSKKTLESHPELEKVTMKFITPEFGEKFFNTLKWKRGEVNIDLEEGPMSFKYYSYLIDENVKPVDLLERGETNMFWKIYCSKTGWDENYAKLIDYFIENGMFNYPLALVNSEKIKCDLQKTYDSIFKGYASVNKYAFLPRNKIGLMIAMNMANKSGYVIDDDVMIGINDNFKDIDNPNLDLLEGYETKCCDLLKWGGHSPTFQMYRNKDQFKNLSGFFLLPTVKNNDKHDNSM